MPKVVAALLLLAAAPGRAPVKLLPAADGRCYTNAATFMVPYALTNPPPRTALQKPALYYSVDQGAHWNLGPVDVDGASPVTFHAPGEGEYWLRMGLRRLGETGVPEFGQGREGVLVVVVDTRPPAVRLVPRLVTDASGGLALALRIVAEEEPVESPDVSIHVDWPATESAPASRHLWVERALVGQDYRWAIDRRGPLPVGFQAAAVDAAGNAGTASLTMSVLLRDPSFRALGHPEIARPGAIRAVSSPLAGDRLAAVVEYAVDGAPLGPDERVELWSTSDDGENWNPCTTEEEGDRALLFTAEKAGLYGLRLAIRRGAGYVGEPPARGTRPQAYVVLERGAQDAAIVGLAAAGATRLEAVAVANRPADLAAAGGQAGRRPGSSSSAAPVAASSRPGGPAAADRTPTPPATQDAAALARAAYQRGNYARLQGRYEEASRHFQQVLDYQPEHFEAVNDLAGCLYSLARFEEAAARYARAVADRPRHADARFNLARALLHLRRFDEALAQLDEVVNLNPADGEAWLYRGELLLTHRGDAAGARDCWRRAVALASPKAEYIALAHRRLAQYPAQD